MYINDIYRFTRGSTINRDIHTEYTVLPVQNKYNTDNTNHF